MPQYPGLEPSSNAWQALPEALNAGMQGYQQQKSLQMALMQKAMQQALQGSEIQKNMAMAGKYQGQTAPPIGIDSNGNPVLALPGQSQGQGPSGSGSVEGGAVAPSGSMSSADRSAMLKMQGVNASKMQAQNQSIAAGNQIPRGLATLLRTSGLTTQEANRIDAMPSALNIHNQIVEAIGAFQNNNLSVAQATVNDYISKNPKMSPFFQGYKANPNNQAALYDALTRMGSIEQYKLQLGSQAMPTEDAVIHNQQMYPSLGEIAANSPVVAQKMNALVDTTIRPAVEGPLYRMSLLKNAQGKFPVPVLDTIYGNLNGQLQSLQGKIKTLKGYQQQGGIMQIPPAQSGLPGPAQGNKKPLGAIFGQ